MRVERAVFRYLWSGKTELVRRRAVYQDLRRGGLCRVHFPPKLRFLLTKCVYSAVDSRLPFAHFVRYWVGLSFRQFFPSLFSNSVPHSWKPTGAYSHEGHFPYYVNWGGHLPVHCVGPIPLMNFSRFRDKNQRPLGLKCSLTSNY